MGHNEDDIIKVKEIVTAPQNTFVSGRIAKNVKRHNIEIDKNLILKRLIMCLLTSQQRSGPNSPIAVFLRRVPFPLTIEIISTESNIEGYIKATLQQNGLNRFRNKIPNYFTTNYNRLCDSNWSILNDLASLNGQASKEIERKIADNLSDMFIGFGPKQSRNFLQALGLTKYEIPIDSRITDWLNKFGFPVSLDSTALQDKGYYHFVSDGIQILCERANIYPCVLDAAIFSSIDNNQWTVENNIY